MSTWAFGAMSFVALLLVSLNVARAGVHPDDPETLEKTQSLGKLIASATKPVHIVYVHGMNVEGPGASDKFRKGLCRYVAGLCPEGFEPTGTTQMLPLGERPNATYLEQPIWRDEDEWKASTPFVYRYVYPRTGAPPVIVDEVNWWPLLFPPKCRFIVQPEINLSGVDKEHLRLCARNDAPFHAWITPAELRAALAHKPVSGGGAWLNKKLKQSVMNWGFSDAVLALGPLRSYFRQAMNLAFDYASHFDATDVEGQDFVVISESLGSFAVLDAFGNIFNDSHEAQRVGERTAHLYFFANQYALLELGRIDGIPESSRINGGPPPEAIPGTAAMAPAESLTRHLLRRWAYARPRTAELEFAARPKQLIAFSDPSDLLTFPVPKLRDENGTDIALVVNVYDRNEWSFFRLFANPLKAHMGHSGNEDVLKMVLQ